MLSSLPREILMGIRLTLVFGVATLIYSLAITGIGQVVFNDQANGSLLKDKNGQVVGSKLIGQWFDPADLKYFHPRPSATVGALCTGAVTFWAFLPSMVTVTVDESTPLPTGFTPLFFAVREGRTDVVRILLAAGADVNEAMQSKKSSGRAPARGTTPLILAVENGHFELAVALLEAALER